MKTYLIVYFGTVLLAMLLVPIITRLGKRYHSINDSTGHSEGDKLIPRIGGIAFVVSTLALIIPMFFLNNGIGQAFRESRIEFIALLAAGSFVFMVGLIDDLRPLRAYIKLLCLIAASLAICASGATFHFASLGRWLALDIGWAAFPLTIFWIVTITVGMNLMDGLDGLAAGIGTIMCGSIVLLALWNGQVAMAVLMIALMGSMTGFLFFNFYPAKVFMGDCGSMFLGFMIGAGSIVYQAQTSTLVGLALPFLVLGVPILDMGFVIIRRRILERSSIFGRGPDLLHHRLLDLGLHQRTVVIIIYVVTAASAGIGVLALTAQGGWSVALLVGGLLSLFSMSGYLDRKRYRGIVTALKRRWALAHEARTEQIDFETAQMRMRESQSLSTWWKTVCTMGEQMHFQSIGLRHQRTHEYVITRVWNAPKGKFPTERTISLSLPLHGGRTGKWELRANVWVDGYLEMGGRQAALLARLMDEFPPPEQEELVIPATANSTKINSSAASIQTALTLVCVTFDESIPDSKIEEFLDDIDQAVEAATASSPPFDDGGAN